MGWGSTCSGEGVRKQSGNSQKATRPVQGLNGHPWFSRMTLSLFPIQVVLEARLFLRALRSNKDP